MRAGFNHIILNSKRVTKIDAAGLGALTLVLMQCRTQGGKAVLLHLDTSNDDNSDELELVAEFETFHDEQDAIGAHAACFNNLIGVDNKILAQHGQLAGIARGGEMRRFTLEILE